jgi:hypothetical protein
MAEQPSNPQSEEKQPVVWRRRVVVIVVLILGAAIAGRVFLGNEKPPVDSKGNPLVTGLVPESGETVEREETLGDKLKKVLPYITEAGMALLLGMILGIGARMAIKTIVLVAIVGVVGIQFAIYKGWMAPEDAGGFIGHMRDYVFHVPEGADGMALLREKAPSAGAGLLGFMMGLKKG